MIRRLNTRILAASLLALFIAFFCGSHLCVHTHIVDGRLVAHSHPYLPSGHHSHSGAGITAISFINNALNSAIKSGDAISVSAFISYVAKLFWADTASNSTSAHIHFSLRAPPAAMA